MIVKGDKSENLKFTKNCTLYLSRLSLNVITKCYFTILRDFINIGKCFLFTSKRVRLKFNTARSRFIDMK